MFTSRTSMLQYWLYSYSHYSNNTQYHIKLLHILEAFNCKHALPCNKRYFFIILLKQTLRPKNRTWTFFSLRIFISTEFLTVSRKNFIFQRDKSRNRRLFWIPLPFAIAKALSRSNTKESLWRHCSNKILISLQITSTEHRIMYLTVPN